MKFVRNLTNAPRMWSNWSAAGAAVLAVQEALPVWEPFVPEGTFAILSAAVASATIFLRLVDQGLDS